MIIGYSFTKASPTNLMNYAMHPCNSEKYPKDIILLTMCFIV